MNILKYLKPKNMKSRKLLSLTALCALGMSFAACSSDDPVINTPEKVSFALSLDMPLNVNSPKLTAAKAVLTNVSTKEQFVTNKFRLNGSQYTDTLTLPIGVYNVAVEGQIAYAFDDSTMVTSSVKTTSDNLVVSKSNLVQGKTLALNTYHAQDGLVLSEIFFSGTLTPEGKQYSDDQYIKIANNSDSVLYLDGLAFVESDFLTVIKQDYKPNILDKAMTVDAVYMFPGSGRDYPIQPGKEVVVAINAINHKEFNSKSIDLSSANFEIYDESSNPNFSDTDNPNVPNLINWYDYSASYFSMHNRGFKAYAICRPTVDAQTFIKNYKYTYTYLFTFGEYAFDMDGEAFKIPNDWIIDAVNLSVASEYKWNVTSSALDAGWAHCGSVDKDQSRYGKAVVRKKQNGKWVDTNNSTNDFESDAQPTLFK